MNDVLRNLDPKTRRALEARDAAMSGDMIIDILTAVVTPAPTAAAWTYTVKFRIVDSSGKVHDWFSGDIAAAASDDSSAGTASVSDATPAVSKGYGEVDIEGDAETWADTEVATLTLNGSIMGKTLADKTWTATFTAA